MSKRADLIRKAVESKGYTVDEIHYLKPGAHLEKGGQEGGWEVYTDYDNVSGWTYQDVLDEIKDWPAAEELPDATT